MIADHTLRYEAISSPICAHLATFGSIHGWVRGGRDPGYRLVNLCSGATLPLEAEKVILSMPPHTVRLIESRK